MNDLTPEVLGELERLLAKSTQLDWRWSEYDHAIVVHDWALYKEGEGQKQHGVNVCRFPSRPAHPKKSLMTHEEWLANQELVPLMKNSLRALIAAARERDRLLDVVQGTVNRKRHELLSRKFSYDTRQLLDSREAFLLEWLQGAVSEFFPVQPLKLPKELR